MPRDEHFYYELPEILEKLDINEILNQIPKFELPETFFDELNVGDKTALHIKVTRKMILLYAMLSNDYNPIHVDLNYGKKTFFTTNIAHGILVASFGSGVVGSRLVGEGVALMGIKNLEFKDAVKIDDRIVVSAEIIQKYSEEIKGKPRYFIDIDFKVINEDTKKVATQGLATVMVFNKSRPKK